MRLVSCTERTMSRFVRGHLTRNRVGTTNRPRRASVPQGGQAEICNHQDRSSLPSPDGHAFQRAIDCCAALTRPFNRLAGSLTDGRRRREASTSSMSAAAPSISR